MQRLINKFTRVTSTGFYLPEIDGLRFLAISWIFVYHINDYLIKYRPADETKILQVILGNGHLGVELFFVISGFVLSLPFARYYFQQGKKVSLKQYFIRRLTRLEPPYFLVMIFLLVFLASTKLYTARELLPHLTASLLYIHNIVYPGTLPVINSVAWSLEIEIQFYIMVPLLAYIFILQTNMRRITLISIMTIMPVIQYFHNSDIIFFYQYIQYFIAGFLLADLYINFDKHYFYKPANRMKKKLLSTLGLVVLASILIIRSSRNDLIYTVFIPLQIVLFYFIVLFIPFWKRVFSLQLISVIGGMCYTIYLLHVPLIATFGRFFVKYGITDQYFIYFITQFFILGIITITVSCLFFFFIEKPCMQKDWYLKLYTPARREKKTN